MTIKGATLIARVLDRILLVIATIGLVAMMLHISVDILLSLLVNAPLATTSAIVTNYYMIAVAFLPILAAEYRGSHIGVSLATDKLPPRLKHGLETLVLAITLAVYGLLTTQSWQQALEKLSISAYTVEQTSKIYVWPSFFMLPAAFGAMTLLLALKVALRLTTGSDAALRADEDAGIATTGTGHD
jgi:TRAP-type C4-dicarboxylate transport system permease small subunit